MTLRQSGLPFRRPPATGPLGRYPGRTFTGKPITASQDTPHTSRLEILNGFPSGPDLLTRPLPGCPGCSREQIQMSRSLRSTPITGASSLLRTGPPARDTHRYSAPHGFSRSVRSLPPPPFRGGDCIGTRLPTFCTEAADQAPATSMPDTAWPISGRSPGSSRDRIDTPVSMPFPTSRHVSGGSLTFGFLVPV